MASKAARDRFYFASKLWRGRDMPGWASVHWNMTVSERRSLNYFFRHKHIEVDGLMYRLTDAGRAALQSDGGAK